MNTAIFKNIADTALGLLYPRDIYCLCCGDTMESSRIHGVCDECARAIDWNTEDPFADQEGCFSFDKVLPCCRYGYFPRQIISGFKLSGRPYSARPLGRLLAERVLMEGEEDFILAAVPMFIEKEKKRGFNQAELMAAEAAGCLDAPYQKGLLVKTRQTRSMRLSDGNTRRSTYRNDFSLAPGMKKLIEGRHIMLVDDVVTTGSTADACARVLKENGAAKVTVLCFAAASNYIFMDIQGANDV